MVSKQWIGELRLGQTANINVLVAHGEVRKAQNGCYLALTLADRTGKIAAKQWNPSRTECEALSSIKFARIAGEVQEYKGERQLILSGPLQPIHTPSDLSDYVESSPIPCQELLSRLHKHIASVHDSRFNSLLRSIFTEDKKIYAAFIEYPAALDYHHAFRHGLLHHTLEVTDIVAALADQQKHWGGQPIHRDLVVTGALLHDIGKVEEMRAEDFEYDFSSAGSLLGHITLGAVYVARKIARIRRNMAFPDTLEQMLLHLISSHHGKGEWGSPKAPATLEAVLLHMADKTSTDLYFIQEARSKGANSNAFVMQRKLDSGFDTMGRFVFVGDMDAFVPPVDATTTESPQEAYSIPREFRLPVLKLISAEEATNDSIVTRSLPLLGKIAAGQPILNSENCVGHELVDATALGSGNGYYYLLRVRGDSMTGDGIIDGDLIVVRHQEQADFGDLVVALLDDEGATVKRLVLEKGKVFLMPSNPVHSPITVPDVANLKIQGRVVGIARSQDG